MDVVNADIAGVNTVRAVVDNAHPPKLLDARWLI